MSRAPTPYRVRVARMGALAVGFAVLAFVLFVVAVILDRRGALPAELPALVPLNVQVDVPQLKLALAAVFLAASVLTGIAALEAAAAMQVLARHQARARGDVLPVSESGRDRGAPCRYAAAMHRAHPGAQRGSRDRGDARLPG